MLKKWTRRTSTPARSLDRGVLYGMCTTVLLIVGGMVMSGGSLLSYMSIGSACIVFGGSLGATMIQYGPRDLATTWRALKEVIQSETAPFTGYSSYFVRLAHAVRAQGRVSVLEAESLRTTDRFLKFALELAADGQQSDEVRKILELEKTTTHERALRAVHVVETMGNFAPALGLIGTVIGLIQMMGSLQDPKSVGPAMGTALITTFYGAVASNLLFLPLAGKLRIRAEADLLRKNTIIEGIISVGNEENPMLVDQRLHVFHSSQGA